MAPPSFSLGPMTQRIAVIVGALALSTTPLAAQPVPPSGETDGLLHAELTLNRQLAHVLLCLAHNTLLWGQPREPACTRRAPATAPSGEGGGLCLGSLFGARGRAR